MGTKTISIMNDVYKLLIARKRANESFSEIIRRTLKKKSNIMDFAGAWKDMSEEEAEKMKKIIYDLRKKSTKELIES